MSMPQLTLNQPFPEQPTRRQKLQPVACETLATQHVSSHSLLAGARELVIQHQGSEYHLRLTRNDKLILTK